MIAKKCKIKVHTFFGGEPNREPEVEEVEAWCVGGDEGVFAVWQHPEEEDWINIAHGDDGHWVFEKTISKFWVDGIIEALSLSMLDNETVHKYDLLCTVNHLEEESS